MTSFSCMEHQRLSVHVQQSRISDFIENAPEEGLRIHKVASALLFLLSQVFIPVLFPPLAAHGMNLTKYVL